MQRQSRARSQTVTHLSGLAVIYARVSSRDQEEGFSIDAQLDLLRSYAARSGLEVASEFVDVETAKAVGRTGFTAMLDFIRKSRSAVTVLVEKTDRIYRNLKDYTTLDEFVRDRDTRIHLVKESEVLGRDASSHAKFVHGIKVLMAKNYVDNLSEEVVKGMSKKAEMGQYPSYPPVGYLWSRDKRTLLPHPDTAGYVRQVFELYASGCHSLQGVAIRLNEEGFRTRSGKPLSNHGVEQLLKNPIYYGDFYWRGQLYQGRFEALVSRDLWDTCQRILRRKNHPERYQKSRLPYLGLFTCAGCGCAITGEMKKGRFIYYRCSNGKKACKPVYIRQEEIELQLYERVSAVEIPERMAGWLSESLDLCSVDDESSRKAAQENLTAEVGALKAKIDRLYTDHVNGKIDEPFFKEKWNQWKSELSRKEHDLDQTRSRSAGTGKIHARNALELAKRAKSLFEKGDGNYRARLANALLSNPTISGATVGKDYRFPFWLWAKNGGEGNWREIRDTILNELREKQGSGFHDVKRS